MRIKIMHNIGVLFVKMGQSLHIVVSFILTIQNECSSTKVKFHLHFAGQYNDACSSFEWIMSEQVHPTYHSNLLKQLLNHFSSSS